VLLWLLWLLLLLVVAVAAAAAVDAFLSGPSPRCEAILRSLVVSYLQHLLRGIHRKPRQLRVAEKAAFGIRETWRALEVVWGLEW